MAKRDSLHTAILQVAIDIPLDTLFDYRHPLDYPNPIQPGSRVKVPFGNRSKIGIVVAQSVDSNVAPSRLKTIEAVLDPEPLLSVTDLELLKWASRYYHHPIGEVLASAFPIALRQGKPALLHEAPWVRLSAKGQSFEPESLLRSPRQKQLLTQLRSPPEGAIAVATLKPFKQAIQALLQKDLLEICQQPETPYEQGGMDLPLQANLEQQQAIDAIVNGLDRFSVSLLQGVTGSGKTEVYMQVIAETLKRNLQVMVLLPEITLTPQLEQRFRQRFRVPIVCSHSKLSDSERLHAWLSMKLGKSSILLGTRSALFTPLARPGLIILDEEHDSSFKQQEGFRFSCRDVAINRGKMLNIPVVLGSATPSMESLFNANRGRYRLLELNNRAGGASQPSFQILDIRNKPLQEGLSEPLIKSMESALQQKQQVLLFLNRRGFAPVQICHGCGWVARCRHCDANLVIHAAERRLRCHHCGSEQALSKRCPSCLTDNLQAVGLGTERIEQALLQLFPYKTVIRLDRDTTQRKGTLEDYLEKIHQGNVDIILGTQMLAKGHHFPEVTLVAVLDIDSSLFSIDFRAEERLAQLLSQVAGRAGRADKPGKVILQTRQPQHPLLITLINQGYSVFAEKTLLERSQAELPPYSHQALFRADANDIRSAQQFLQTVQKLCHQFKSLNIAVFGPIVAPMARRAGQFRYQLLIQSTHRKALHQLLDQILPEIYTLNDAKKVRWSLDIDPQDMF